MFCLTDQILTILFLLLQFHRCKGRSRCNGTVRNSWTPWHGWETRQPRNQRQVTTVSAFIITQNTGISMLKLVLCSTLVYIIPPQYSCFTGISLSLGKFLFLYVQSSDWMISSYFSAVLPCHLFNIFKWLLICWKKE